MPHCAASYYEWERIILSTLIDIKKAAYAAFFMYSTAEKFVRKLRACCECVQAVLAKNFFEIP